MKSTDRNPVLVLIGKKVRELRRLNSDYANYEVFAWENRINKSTVYKIETGQNYQIDSLLRVLGALDVSLSEFFSGIDHIPKK
jgi:transcriptional regulator with XRE-family HTH domain